MELRCGVEVWSVRCGVRCGVWCGGWCGVWCEVWCVVWWRAVWSVCVWCGVRVVWRVPLNP